MTTALVWGAAVCDMHHCGHYSQQSRQTGRHPSRRDARDNHAHKNHQTWRGRDRKWWGGADVEWRSAHRGAGLPVTDIWQLIMTAFCLGFSVTGLGSAASGKGKGKLLITRGVSETHTYTPIDGGHKVLAPLWGLVTTKMLIPLRWNLKWGPAFEKFNHNRQMKSRKLQKHSFQFCPTSLQKYCTASKIKPPMLKVEGQQLIPLLLLMTNRSIKSEWLISVNVI